jgi:hypothetical protein
MNVEYVRNCKQQADIAPYFLVISCLAYPSTLKMEAVTLSKHLRTSTGLGRAITHNNRHRCENF